MSNKSGMFDRLIKLTACLRIDVYYFLFSLGLCMTNLPLDQLIEDKICINDLELDQDICRDVEHDSTRFQDEISPIGTIETLTWFKNYQTLFTLIPEVIVSILLARWIDLFPSHLRYLLAFPCVGVIMFNILIMVQCINFQTETNSILYPFIFIGIFGGRTLVNVGVFTYVRSKTKAKYRLLRFALLQSAWHAALAIADTTSSRILSLEPWILGQYRNYVGTFMASGSIMALTELWILFTLNDSVSYPRKFSRASIHTLTTGLEKEPEAVMKSNQLSVPSTSYGNSGLRRTSGFTSRSARLSTDFQSRVESRRTSESTRSHQLSVTAPGESSRRTSVASILMSFSLMNTRDRRSLNSGFNSHSDIGLGFSSRRASIAVNSDVSSSRQITLDLVSCGNLTKVMKSFFRKRFNHGQSQLLGLTFSVGLVAAVFTGEATIAPTFAENTYRWSRQKFVRVDTFTRVLPLIAKPLTAYLLFHRLGMTKVNIVLCGCLSMIIASIVKGCLYYEMSWYLSFVGWLLGGLIFPTIICMITKIVYSYETGQVFAVVMAMAAFAAYFSSLIYPVVLKATIDSYCGLVFFCGTVLLIYPLMTVLAVDLVHRQAKVKKMKRLETLSMDLEKLKRRRRSKAKSVQF